MADADVVVIGAGVVGLACAARCASSGRSVLVLEAREGLGQETSSRNSGVIHAGIHYPVDSNKTRLCIRGRQLLYERCRRRGIGYRQVGKLIVASGPSELVRLQAIGGRAARLGVEASLIEGPEARRRQPGLQAEAALWSPTSGIVDVHGLMYDLKREASAAGALFAWQTRVLGLEATAAGWRVETLSGEREGGAVTARWVINAAGLRADEVAALAGLDPESRGWRLRLCKGDYFQVAGLGPLNHLIYPLPQQAGLGIHLTMDLGGQVLAGPDATYVDQVGYGVDPAKADEFARALRPFLPSLRAEQLQPAYSGIRPKLQGPHDDFRDFVIVVDPPRMVQLVGIESPGLTASLAIAEQVEIGLAERD